MSYFKNGHLMFKRTGQNISWSYTLSMCLHMCLCNLIYSIFKWINPHFHCQLSDWLENFFNLWLPVLKILQPPGGKFWPVHDGNFCASQFHSCILSLIEEIHSFKSLRISLRMLPCFRSYIRGFPSKGSIYIVASLFQGRNSNKWQSNRMIFFGLIGVFCLGLR